MSKGDLMTDTEKATLERRIDELCQENERLHADQAHWELGNCPSCPNIADLQEALDENAKLRELVRDLYYETKSPSNHATQVEIRMSELRIEVD